MFICKHIKDNFFINFINLVNKMKLGKRLSDKTKNNSLQRFILYFLVLAFVTSLISSIVLSILLVCTKRDLSLTVDGFTLDAGEAPILGQFGPVATVILLIGFPFILLLTLVAYSFYISVDGIKNKLDVF
tara:strand:- start:3 stop:392 length:390 start_codon:yes stop_codon:yes gene_type:complete